MLEVGNSSGNGIGQLLPRNVEPQVDGIPAGSDILRYDTRGVDAVQYQRIYLRIGGVEIELYLDAGRGPLLFGQVLPFGTAGR